MKLLSINLYQKLTKMDTKLTRLIPVLECYLECNFILSCYPSPVRE